MGAHARSKHAGGACARARLRARMLRTDPSSQPAGNYVSSRPAAAVWTSEMLTGPANGGMGASGASLLQLAGVLGSPFECRKAWMRRKLCSRWPGRTALMCTLCMGNPLQACEVKSREHAFEQRDCRFT